MSERTVLVGNTSFKMSIDEESGCPKINIIQSHNASFGVNIVLHQMTHDKYVMREGLKELGKQLIALSEEIDNKTTEGN